MSAFDRDRKSGYVGKKKNKTEHLLQRSGCPRIKLVLIERLLIEELPRASICNNPEI